MRTATFPVVIQHREALALKAGRPVSTSMLPFVSVLLVARGADQIVIPAPDAMEREHAEGGIRKLPPERRDFVTLCDTNGEDLARVKDYLELKRQARKWPEDAFVGFAEGFLYEAVVATRNRAGVLSNSASVVRGFVPIIDAREFSGEARFRLAELCRLICSYEPAAVQHGMYGVDTCREAVTTAWDILKMAEFRALVAASGRIGYLKHPIVALRRLSEKFRDLMRQPAVKPLIRLVSTAADAAGAAGLGEAAAEALGLAAHAGRGAFHLPFISPGPAELPLYRAALREGLPGAVPPEGTIMVFEQSRGGRAIHSWLNVGEEDKLEREARSGLSHRIELHRESMRALDRIAGS
jgi:hypothetical protein